MSEIDHTRRRILGAAGATTVASMLGATLLSGSQSARAETVTPLRWGIVGTGWIANSMAGMIQAAEAATIGAVSSRRKATADEFGERHGVSHRFDSWQAMIDSGHVDAIYVATPTRVREEICIAAANGGKHVLGEKPFASLPSVNRIVAACRNNNVAFMDGTHFVHHPRTLDIKQNLAGRLGAVWSVASAFQFNLPDQGNIRYNTELEPMGAIGDAGWYTMRAAVEYLAADFRYRQGGWGRGKDERISIASDKPGAVLMFEDMAAAAADPGLRDQWMTATARTQALLDAAWMAAVQGDPN